MARTRARAALSPAEIVARLSALYGRPVWRPHGDAMTELVLTILSQNTSDTNSGRAFMRLVARFPTWGELMAAPPGEIESDIQVGGLAATKAPRIKAVLEEVWRRLGSFDLSLLGEQRLGLVPAGTGAAAAHDLLEAALAPAEVYPFHVSLIKHGRRVCRAQRPLCAECPLNDRCPTAPLYLGTKGSRRRTAV